MKQRRLAMPASVKGAVELRKALRKFSPDLAKQLPKEVASALKPITKAAKGYLPDDNQHYLLFLIIDYCLSHLIAN